MARPQATRLAVLALLATAPASSLGADVNLSWDPELVLEWDRANYERTLRGYVENARAEVSSWLGLALERPVAIEVHTRAKYEAQFGTAAAWSRGAHYCGGAIHVNGGARLDGWFAGMLVHEMTHAVLDFRGTSSRLPTWVGAGLAERLQYRARASEGLGSTQVTNLEVALEQRRLTPLPERGYLSEFGYLQCYAAILFMEQKYGRDQLLAVVRRTLERDPFPRALDAELRLTQKDVEEGFKTWVDKLQ